MKRVIHIAILLLTAVISAAQDTVQVVLLAGQSNMEGSGLYMNLSNSDKQRIHDISSRVMISNKGANPIPLTYSVSEYQKERLGFGEVFGPEMFIGLTMAEAQPENEFLLIKLAQGGTALYGAWNPEWEAAKADYAEDKAFKKELKLYEQHQQYIRENLQSLKEQGKPYKIVGMAWMQGENDAAKELCAKNYEANLRKIIAGYRKTLNEPNMPFVLGQINSTYGDFPNGPGMVRNAQRQVALNDPFTEIIMTGTDENWRDFPKHADNVHYNAVGQKRLGCAMAAKLLDLQFGKVAKPSTFIDNHGIMRWTETNSELCLFGTNYNVPFSYWDYRKPLRYDQYKAIDEVATKSPRPM